MRPIVPVSLLASALLLPGYAVVEQDAPTPRASDDRSVEHIHGQDVEMATMAQEQASSTEVKQLAEKIGADQTAEIAPMEDVLGS